MSPPKNATAAPPRTPDGRYIVVRGRLWRASNPALSAEQRDAHVAKLQTARRAVRAAGHDEAAVATARARVDAAKRALGERGPPWWQDGAPDFNRHLAKNTPYADWWAAFSDRPRVGGQRPAEAPHRRRT